MTSLSIGRVSNPKLSNQKLSRQRNSSYASSAICGGIAGISEALVCHPLDTLKVHMQSYRISPAHGMATHAVIRHPHVRQETGFYRGLGAVLLGIAPKMAVRFSSFEFYSTLLEGRTNGKTTNSLFAGLAAGITEAVLVVTPSEVLKIRLQTQKSHLREPGIKPPGLLGTLRQIIRQEGIQGLWRGVGLTASRQGTNQAVNFLAYSNIKSNLLHKQPEYQKSGLPVWQTALCGLMAGSLGPLANAPIDFLKTTVQKRAGPVNAQNSLFLLLKDIIQREGILVLYRGVMPRVLRVGIGQAVTFCTFETVRKIII
ncbi:mitochondrial carrier [Trichoderma sp. SZMC 28013]